MDSLSNKNNIIDLRDYKNNILILFFSDYKNEKTNNVFFC
jgi:hypothetical protein